MPSSITLTVSHLPTSTSFFLSALQPLHYAYRGRANPTTIGFGPTDTTLPADFWLTQEVPGVPAGAAHVAFPATSHTAVQDFFTAALKAGGKIHGEPCTRDESGYYSAAVIDFDGNSIEAVYRPTLTSNPDSDKVNASVVSKRTSASKALTAISRTPSNASKSRSLAVSRAPTAPPSRHPSPPKPSGDALDRILNSARDTADVARHLADQVRPNLNSTRSTPAAANTNSNTSSGADGAIVGTLLGVAAGAALHYAFSNRKSSNSPDSHSSEERGRERRPSINGRSMTAPAPQYEYPRSDSKSLYSRGGGKYITMEDNDASTIHPRSTQSRRRGSVDSGIGMSPPSSASRKSGVSVKRIEAPPSAYKAPTILTQAQSQVGSRREGRARSSSASRAGKEPSMAKRRSSSASRDGHTVLHIQEFGRVRSRPESRDGSQASTVKPSRHTSTSRRNKQNREPESIPLPPSRAATWADVKDARGSTVSRAETAKMRNTVVGLEDIRGKVMQTPTQSVVGKGNALRKLDVTKSEVSPADSISQVSSSRGSRRSRR